MAGFINILETRNLLSAASSPVAAVVGSADLDIQSTTDFSGKWKINLVNSYILTLTQTGKKLEGTFVSNSFNYAVHGKVNGNSFKLIGHGSNMGIPTMLIAKQITLRTGNPNEFEGPMWIRPEGQPKVYLGMLGDRL